MPEHPSAWPSLDSDIVLELTQPDGTRCCARLINNDRRCAECLMPDGRQCQFAFSFGFSWFCRLAAREPPATSAPH